MAISREKKTSIIKELHEHFTRSRVVVFVRFCGLGVAATIVLRRTLRDADAQYMVAKKTLALRVMDGMGISGERPQLDGETAFVFGYADEVAPVRVAHEFAKKAAEAFTITGGVFAGAYRMSAVMGELATIPPREALVGQVVGLAAAPLRGAVSVLAGPLRSFVGVLQAISNKK